MKDPYQILGVSKDATDEEVKRAYHDLARKYHPDNYDDNNPLKDLAEEKMQEINSAYDEITRMRANPGSSSSSGRTYTGSTSGVYYEIRKLVTDRKFRDAEQRLAGISQYDRTAEWHYLASVLLMHRGRVHDAMRELEIACDMDPSNEEYQKAKTMFNEAAGSYGSTYYDNTYYGRPARPNANSADACNCCANLICLDCLCECCGGDLIRCI